MVYCFEDTFDRKSVLKVNCASAILCLAHVLLLLLLSGGGVSPRSFSPSGRVGVVGGSVRRGERAAYM